MVRRTHPGVADAPRQFEDMRFGVERLRALELAQPSPSPAGAALNHAVVSIRLAADVVTRDAEFFGLHYRQDLEGHARTVATFSELRGALDSLRPMADAFRPATPESRALNHAAQALRLAADTVTGRPDFYRIVVGDGTTPARRDT